ncbi:MAG TPA: nicotinate-nucleotide adenylyltransferase [Edaphobacter sp.]|nr:nicotinate-nucleotide adenylyltransferase [Edaphobacter sp.]
MRIALFGGTFDPPHRGHLGAATLAAQAFHLDKVLFAPVGVQPLKEGRPTTPFAHRLAMVRLACEEDPRFEPSLVDSPRPNGAPNYTVDTLATLQQRSPAATLFSVVGADSFLSLPHWKEPHRLLALAEWIVISRPGSPLGDLSALNLTPEELRRVHCIETLHDEVSATELRRRLSAGEDCDGLVTPAVLDYIRQHGLYQVAPGIDSKPAKLVREP